MNGKLVKCLRRDLDWIVFHLDDGKEIKISTKKANNPKQTKLLVDCPKDILITTKEDDGVGNK